MANMGGGRRRAPAQPGRRSRLPLGRGRSHAGFCPFRAGCPAGCACSLHKASVLRRFVSGLGLVRYAKVDQYRRGGSRIS